MHSISLSTNADIEMLESTVLFEKRLASQLLARDNCKCASIRSSFAMIDKWQMKQNVPLKVQRNNRKCVKSSSKKRLNKINPRSMQLVLTMIIVNQTEGYP